MLWAGLLFAGTLLAYGPAFSAGYIWDDDHYVYANPNLRSLEGLPAIWTKPHSSPQYYPLVFTTFWLEYRLWGLAPLGFHVVNVLLHAANAVLLWRVLRWLDVPGAWLAAALFALHPVHVESVAWITERKNTLSLLFYLGSALCFLRCAWPSAPPTAAFEVASSGIRQNSGGPRPSPSDRILRKFADFRYFRAKCATLLGISLALFVAAMLSKTVTATLPAALLLVLWWKNGRIDRRDAAATAPMFLIGIPWGLATAWLERHVVGATGAEWSFSLVERVMIAGRALWFYAGKLVFPSPLMFVYPRWVIDDRDGLLYLFPLAAGAVITALWFLRRRMGRGPLVGVLFFAGTLFPALGFFNVYPMRYSFVADHFQYVASIGIIGMVAGVAVQYAVKRLPVEAAVALAIATLLVLGTLTWRQCLVYHDAETLWRDTLAKNPACEMAHTNLGLLLRDQGLANEALPHLREALRLAPQDAAPYNNLATALSDVGQWAEAERLLGEALRIAPADVVLRYNLARVLREQQKLDAARREYLRVLELDPDYVPARFNLAALLMDQGDRAGATRHLERVLAITPGLAPARELLEKARSDAAPFRGPQKAHHPQGVKG